MKYIGTVLAACVTCVAFCQEGDFPDIEHEYTDEPATYNPLPEDEILPSAAPVMTGFDPYIQIDFLWWFPRQDGIPYAVAFTDRVLSDASEGYFPRKIERLDWDWGPGFRVGLGVTLPLDGWDLLAEWTYFDTCSSDTTNLGVLDNDVGVGQQQKTLFPLWGLPDQFNADFRFSKARATWDFHVNQIDGVLGRASWISTNVNMRPYFGVRGVWTDTDFDTKYESITQQDDLRVTLTSKIHQDFAGAGLVGGVDSLWHFTKNFSLFAEFATALLVGEFEVRNKVRRQQPGDTTQEYTFTARDDIRSNQLIVDYGAGVTWESWFQDGDYHLRIDVGWEEHLWLGHNKFFQFLATSHADEEIEKPNMTFATPDGNLILSGLVVRARFDF